MSEGWGEGMPSLAPFCTLPAAVTGRGMGEVWGGQCAAHQSMSL